MKYCFDCTEWYVEGPQWDDHCQQHLSRLSSKNCASITYRSTLIKPAFCPDCLGTDMSPSLRMKSWDRDADVVAHLEKVHGTDSCLHPLCQDVKFEDEQSFYYHLSDAHGFSGGSGVSRKRKQDTTDMKEQRDEDGFAADSHPHPKKLKSGRNAAACLSVIDLCDDPDDMDNVDIVGRKQEITNTKKPWEEDGSAADSLKTLKGGRDAAACSSVINLCDEPDDMDVVGWPESNGSYDDFVSQCITFSPSPSPSVNGDEALLGRPTEPERETIADADITNASVTGTDGHVGQQKIQIKLTYKRPKIVLRTGKTHRLDKHRRYKKGKGKGRV